MKLQKITISDFRNLEQIDLELDRKINILYGDNGSGKTSFLESIYYFATGKSFRVTNPSAMIAKASQKMTIFSELLHAENLINLGVERELNGKTLLRMDRENIKSHVQIARLLPVQVFTAKDYRILEDGPDMRRQFLDWGLFHVEPSFLEYWQRLQKALKHRNAILKSRSNNINSQIAFWDGEIVASGMKVHEMRKNYLEQVLPILTPILENLLPEENIQLKYLQGWNSEKTLEAILKENFLVDLRFGYTSFGPHKADIQFGVGEQLAKNILSRGQQKLLVYALKIAQGVLLQQSAHKSSIYLIDDLPSELDSVKQQKALAILNEIAAQIYITTVSKSNYPEVFTNSELQLFHVEHGNIKV
jgi:DNA replication and repair protein RecF